jgi:plastocyanin
MKTILPVILLALAAAACSDSSGPGGDPDIEVQDDSFIPGSFSTTAGSTVTWGWTGNNPHNVTWVGAGVPGPSATQSTGTYQRTFADAGTYEYYCTVHGTPTTGMRGTVTVP